MLLHWLSSSPILRIRLMSSSILRLSTRYDFKFKHIHERWKDVDRHLCRCTFCNRISISSNFQIIIIYEFPSNSRQTTMWDCRSTHTLHNLHNILCGGCWIFRRFHRIASAMREWNKHWNYTILSGTSWPEQDQIWGRRSEPKSRRRCGEWRKKKKSTAVASFSHSLNNCNGNVRPGLFGCRAAHRVLLLLSFGVRFLSSSLHCFETGLELDTVIGSFESFYFILCCDFLFIVYSFLWVSCFGVPFLHFSSRALFLLLLLCSMLLVQIYSKALKRPVICARYHDALPTMVSWWDVKSLRRACFFPRLELNR